MAHHGAHIFPVKQAGRFFVASEVEEVEKAATCHSAWNFFMMQIKCAYFLKLHYIPKFLNSNYLYASRFICKKNWYDSDI